MWEGWSRDGNRPKNAQDEHGKPPLPAGASVFKAKHRRTTAKAIVRAERKYFSYEDIQTIRFRKREHHDSLSVSIRKTYSKVLLTIIYRGKH